VVVVVVEDLTHVVAVVVENITEVVVVVVWGKERWWEGGWRSLQRWERGG
jgi:hypothetical protein